MQERKVRADYLSSYFTLNRRYSRSINLERDIIDPDRLAGYVVTNHAEQSLRRILEGVTGAQSSCAWILTGVYGTGKSAFAHFLASLLSSHKKEMRPAAERILRENKTDRTILDLLRKRLPGQGVVRATVTAQREPVTHTVVRALRNGVELFFDWRSNAFLKYAGELDKLQKAIVRGKEIEPGRVLPLVKEIAEASRTGLILIIDELGKCLEYAARNRGAGDLYLLQQISELPNDGEVRVCILGILHQAFSEYGYGLGSVERNEWAKIQGRFEELPFTESPDQMTRLIGEVIQCGRSAALEKAISQQADSWFSKLSKLAEIRSINSRVLAGAYPLHPITALTLPLLCIRYAQNDRSLFTFLTGAEPHSLRIYLEETHLSGDEVPLLKLDRLYDYFVDSVGVGMASHPNFQRWSEVKGLIKDYRQGSPDELRVLKTIGILNLATTTSFLKASRQLVAFALCDRLDDRSQQKHWERIIDGMIERGLVIRRQQVDELRIWEGSDFDIEAAIADYCEKQRAPLAKLLAQAFPLRPQVAQRHSYQTGNLRYFERRYLDSSEDLNGVKCQMKESAGLVGYWVEDAPPALIHAQTADYKPLVLIYGRQLETLRRRALELMALEHIQSNAAQLQADGVARREVRHRLAQARNLLDDAFVQTFGESQVGRCWIAGKPESLSGRKKLSTYLSDLCDETYKHGPTLWNELINRQELTSQGAKANRQVIVAMLEQPELENLGLRGSGPEASIYVSVLQRTGIHRKVDDVYGFHPPTNGKIKPAWNAIERFCLEAKDKPRSLDQLYEVLEQPPYGVKLGVIPILFAAVILKHTDDVSIYKDGAFIPVLGPEHFELLVKNPARFSVKHYEVLGLRAQVFRELEGLLASRVGIPEEMRNKTLLGIISPLLQFVRRLPPYTQKTEKLSPEAKAVRQVLLEAHEPDKLLFETLPTACGLKPITEGGVIDPNVPRELRERLIAAFKELREAYEKLISQCREYIHSAFGVRQGLDRLREDLRSRASYLQGRSIEPILTRFVLAATDDLSDDQNWLRGLVMVIADKPSESWSDADADSFELKLSDVARRFKHLEAIIHHHQAASTVKAEARRISLTRTDGTELNDVAWIEESQRESLETKASKVIAELNLDFSQQRALLAILTERILGAALGAAAASFGSRKKSGGKGGETDEAHPRVVRW
jgi:hypothetical protein